MADIDTIDELKKYKEVLDKLKVWLVEEAQSTKRFEVRVTCQDSLNKIHELMKEA